MKPLSKAQILSTLKTKYSEEDEKTLQEIAYNLSLASTVESNLEERAKRALTRLQAQNWVKVDPLKEDAQRATKSRFSKCPICKMAMDSVKLVDDRDAFYCGEHRVVVPFPSVSDQEADV